MNLLVRNTLAADMPELVAISNHPLVRALQFPRIGEFEFCGEFGRVTVRGGIAFTQMYSTILLDEKIVGYVDHHHWRDQGVRMCQCGWNLHPDVWGRGVMCLALTNLFDVFFGPAQVDCVVADTFWNNSRCLRVLAKLGFAPEDVPLWQRATIAWQMRSVRWIVRHRLMAESWRGRQSSRTREAVSS